MFEVLIPSCFRKNSLIRSVYIQYENFLNKKDKMSFGGLRMTAKRPRRSLKPTSKPYRRYWG